MMRCVSPLIVLLALRVKFSTEIPCTAMGAWKAMKIPALARSSTGMRVISFPSKKILPPVTVYFGCPMTALNNVDFPAPFVPMMT